MTVAFGIATFLGVMALLFWRPGRSAGPGQSALWRLTTRLIAALSILIPLALIPPGLVVLGLGQDHALLPSALAGTVIATGWIVTFVLREYQTTNAREQTRIDTLAALRTEVLTVLNKLDDLDLGQGARQQQDKINGGALTDEGYYHPFSSTESPPSVFNAIADKTLVLHPETIEPVLRFYAAYSDLTSFTEDFRGTAFASLPAERRVVGHKALTQLRRSALYWALAAINAIDDASGAYPKPKIERSGKNKDIVL